MAERKPRGKPPAGMKRFANSKSASSTLPVSGSERDFIQQMTT